MVEPLRGYFSEAMQKRRVVVVGAGFVGLEVCIQLRKRLGDEVEVILVAPTEEFVYYPHIHLLLRDIVTPDDLTIDLKTFCRRWGVHFVRGEVQSINHENNSVIFEEGELYFDFVVIGVGAESSARHQEGLNEMFQFRTLDDVQVLKRHFDNLFRELPACDAKATPYACRCIVVGGGIAGVEILFELWHYVRDRCRDRGFDFSQFKFLLVERKDTLLADKNEKLIRHVTKELESRGIQILTGHEVVRGGREYVVCRREAEPASEDQHARENFDFQAPGAMPPPMEEVQIESKTIIWSGGVVPNPVIKEYGIPLKNGYNHGIVVEDTLQVESLEDYFAGGDCICWVQKARLQTIAATAHNAKKHGQIIARNIAYAAKGRKISRFKAYAPNVHTPHTISLNGFERGVFAKGPRVLRYPSKLFGWLKKRQKEKYFERVLHPKEKYSKGTPRFHS